MINNPPSKGTSVRERGVETSDTPPYEPLELSAVKLALLGLGVGTLALAAGQIVARTVGGIGGTAKIITVTITAALISTAAGIYSRPLIPYLRRSPDATRRTPR